MNVLDAFCIVREYSRAFHRADALWHALNRPDVRPLFGACDDDTFSKFCREFVAPEMALSVHDVPPGGTVPAPPQEAFFEMVETESPDNDFELAEVGPETPAVYATSEESTPKKKARVEPEESSESSEDEPLKRQLRSRLPKAGPPPKVGPPTGLRLEFNKDEYWCAYGCGYRDKGMFSRVGAKKGYCVWCKNKTTKSKIKPVFVNDFDRAEHPGIRGRVTWAEEFFTCTECGCFRHKDSFSAAGVGKGVCLVHANASDHGARVQKKERNCDLCHMNHPLDAFTGLALKRGGRIKCREAGGIWAEEDEDEEDLEDEERSKDESESETNSFIAPEDDE
jgi:hypothetical protein